LKDLASGRLAWNQESKACRQHVGNSRRPKRGRSGQIIVIIKHGKMSWLWKFM